MRRVKRKMKAILTPQHESFTLPCIPRNSLSQRSVISSKKRESPGVISSPAGPAIYSPNNAIEIQTPCRKCMIIYVYVSQGLPPYSK